MTEAEGSMGFGPDLLDRLRSTREVRIETRMSPDSPAHRAIIWVVVDDRDRVLIRTYLGPSTRWFREAVAHPDCLLWLRSEAIPVIAVDATDPDRIEAATRGYQAKYGDSSSTRGMVAEVVLPTTLELLPR
jgi:hypothetical protein